MKGVDEQVTLQQVLRLIEALKEKGYTLDEIIEILERTAKNTDK